jgi:hypothetical protein
MPADSIDATMLDLSSIVKDERQHVVSDHIAKAIVEKRSVYVAEQLAAYPDLDQYGPRVPRVEFVKRLVMAGRLTILGSSRFPVELYYLDDQPLIGFMPPGIKMQQVEGATAITLHNVVLGAEEMPDRHDETGHRLLVAIMLQAMNNAATKT